MSAAGSAFENLVRTVEEFFLAKGCKVESRKLVYGDGGAQVAELDIVITGRLGSTDIRWLIECRDRPSEGKAPTSWIEQLYGRKQVHKFNQVTAVSTTGFAAGASEVAARLGIELRTVSDASASDVASWFTGHFKFRHNVGELQNALVIPMDNEAQGRLAALEKRLAGIVDVTKEKLLRSSKTNDLISIPDAFASALTRKDEMFDDVSPNDEEGKPFTFHALYPNDDDHFLIDTGAGAIRIKAYGT